MGRLIDADRLKVMFEIEECPCALQAAILGIIDEQPTAYAPGRVVEQLEVEFKKYYGENWNKAPYLIRAIEIVKEGGINDNTD